MPWRWRQLGVAYTAQPGVANTAQLACLVDGLVGASATQLPWPIGSQDHHGHLALSGLNNSWQQVGHSCARAGDDGGRSSADTTWWMNRSLKDVESGAPSCSMSVAWMACGNDLQGSSWLLQEVHIHVTDMAGRVLRGLTHGLFQSPGPRRRGTAHQCTAPPWRGGVAPLP